MNNFYNDLFYRKLIAFKGEKALNKTIPNDLKEHISARQNYITVSKKTFQ